MTSLFAVHLLGCGLTCGAVGFILGVVVGRIAAS